MEDVFAAIERWRDRGEDVALATLVAARRSAPRPIGSRFAISSSGEVAGSISGGCVEADVAEVARDVLAGGEPRAASYGIDDETAWSVGLPCGGEIDLVVAPLADDAPVRAAAEVLRRRERAVLWTGPLGELALVRADGSTVGPLPEADWLETPIGPRVRLIVVGAVDIAEHLCRGAAALGWRTVVVDPRPALVSAERVPSADERLVGWPDDTLEELALDASTAVVVLTHDEKFDLPALRTALASNAFYVAALGSRRTQKRRREQLLGEGLDEKALARLSGPAGLDLGAETPAETALSILAEVVARSHGRAGGPLTSLSGPIHGGTDERARAEGAVALRSQ